MNKIGIITTNNTRNNGALLQAFALYKFISKHCQDVKIINYYPRYLKKQYRIIRYGITFRYIFFFFHDLINISIRYESIRKFISFRTQYLNQTQIINNDKEFKHNCEVFDVYISGSDQIWNPRVTGEKIDPNFFCSFAPKEKKVISYAASFGNYSFSSREKLDIARLLNKYNTITVREKTGVEFLKSIGFDSIQVVDPVFLLSEEEWVKIFNLRKKKNKNKKLFVYTITNSKRTLRLVYSIFKNDYDISSTKPINELKKYTGIAYKNSIGPLDFLSEIFNADLIITNSFHCMAFSIIFKKNFFVISNARDICRIKDLLTEISLNDRLISLDDIKEIFKFKKIDYQKINDQVEKIIIKSKNKLIKDLYE